MKLNSVDAFTLGDLLPRAALAKPEVRDLECLAFQWLIRAWHEEDSISKFAAFFTAIEIILEGFSPPPNPEDEWKASRIQALIQILPQNEAKELSQFFQRLISGRRPSLVSRFEILAKEAGMKGADADIAAFRYFNSVRNKLLHRGEQRIDLIVTLSETEIRQLEDLTERYVNWVFFRDENVYRSMFRQKTVKPQSNNPSATFP